MKSGDTFRIKYPRDIFHPFVVISAPEKLPDVIWKDYVFLVMLSTKESWKDNSCVLTPTDLSPLTHDSVAVFESPPSLWITLGHLQTLKEQKRLHEYGAVTPEALQRLREGYANSDYQMDKVYQFLWRQGLVD